MKCKLIRITDNGHTRTKEMIGECSEPPTIGHPFVIVNDQPLDRRMDGRMIETSPVQTAVPVYDYDGKRKVQFSTLNTDYVFEEVK